MKWVVSFHDEADEAARKLARNAYRAWAKKAHQATSLHPSDAEMLMGEIFREAENVMALLYRERHSGLDEDLPEGALAIGSLATEDLEMLIRIYIRSEIDVDANPEGHTFDLAGVVAFLAWAFERVEVSRD